jgi:predicted exporter
VFSRYFSVVFDKFSQRKQLVVGLATIVAVAAGVGLESISLENDIALMLPGDDEILRSIRFLQESHFSDNLIISLEAKSSDRPSRDLLGAVAQLEAHLGPPLVSEVVSGVSRTEMVEEMLAFLKHVPQLIDDQARSRIGSQITPEGVETSLRRSFRQLVSPASTFMIPFVRSDPLGISSGPLRSLQRLSTSLGYEVEIENGHFVSRDGAHALLIVQTPITVTDASGARELVAYLRERLRKLPDSVSADIIGGHLHTISNEDVIKRDIWLALSIASAAFLLLFLFLFRDIRALLLFLIPLASVLVSINVSNMVLSRLSYFIVGMGGVIAGISVDYGIHVYMAVRSSNGRADAVKLVAKPVVTGALTTLGVFSAFFFSSVQGYHQLALFSIVSIVLCLAISLFLLPHLLSRPQRARSKRTSGKHGFWRSQDQARVIIACWILAMVAAVVSARHLTFDSDIRQFDGSEPDVLQAEEKFHRVWGGRDQPAVFVVSGEDLDGAFRRNRLVYRDVMAVMGETEFSSLSAIWPLKEERDQNAERWKQFWMQGRESELKRLLREHGAAYDFSEDAFSPFFDNLYSDPGPENELGSLGVFSRLKERFVQEGQNGWQVLSFFPDEERFVVPLSDISGRHPGTFLVSRNALSRGLSRSIASEIVFLSAIAALLIPILAGLLLRDLRLTALSLVPVATGIMAVLGTIPVLGLSLNAPAVISSMVVVGLCVDYGIFVVYACHYQLETGTYTAVTLSAVTTLIGTGVLLFARHPILFSIGATMVTGVLAGYVSAMFVVPALYRRFLGE